MATFKRLNSGTIALLLTGKILPWPGYSDSLNSSVCTFATVMRTNRSVGMSIGGIGGIDTSRIEAMMAQLKAAAAKPAAGPVAPTGVAEPASSTKVNFSDALKSSLNSVSESQNVAEDMGKRFAMGDESVNLSDTMIAMQKANIGFQATVQVRNKMVAAYHEIMNMQV
jgi:flagellar hook-basal body complex protein FliE